MRFSSSGLSSVATSFVPQSVSRAVSLGLLLPATLVASTAFAQVPPPVVNARS
jgi:serine-type D-Ala-D-Ala carboxypeptidase (penicillin-binding protein 5/6)